MFGTCRLQESQMMPACWEQEVRAAASRWLFAGMWRP